jgi:hypothetical protein
MTTPSPRTACSTGLTAIVMLSLALSAEAEVFPCAAGNIACVIRAIHEANANGSPTNTIHLAAGTYTLLKVDNDTNGPNGLPSITSPLTIDVADGGTATVERAVDAPRFRLVHVAAGGSLTLRAVVLSNGASSNGGALFNDGGVVTLIGSTIAHNSAVSAGAISNTGTLTIEHSDVTLNRALRGAGLVTSSGVVRIADSRFDGNSSSSGGPGAIWVRGGRMAISKTSIASNFADDGAAGIAVDRQAVLTVINSAFVANHTRSQAAAVYNAGTTDVRDTSFAGNIAALEQPQGLALAIANAGTLNLINTTLADNRGESAVNAKHFVLGTFAGAATSVQNTMFSRGATEQVQDCGGVVTSRGNNLLSAAPLNCALTLQESDLVGDAALAAFTDNGEPGNGHFPLQATSPALDAGNREVCDATDQIGQSREGRCDIGAIEFKKTGGER